MIKKIQLLIVILLLSFKGISQDTSYDKYFLKAIEEMTNMLEGRQELSFKRAVFLNENACAKGTLNYDEFCQDINEIVKKLNHMIQSNNLQAHKTAGNYAIFGYMTEKLPYNNHQKMVYDIDGLIDGNNEAHFVSHLLKTNKGNCHSLPYLYKILADEMNVEACIATAPNHYYVKHHDEEGKWWNIELTTGTSSRTSWIIESFGVTDEAIESGLYLKPLDGKELIALCLCDLIGYYEQCTGRYYGEVVQKACDVGLQYTKASHLQLWKNDEENYRLGLAMKAKGIKSIDQIDKYPDLLKMYAEVEARKNYIKQMGYSSMTPQEYRDKIKKAQEGKFDKYQN